MLPLVSGEVVFRVLRLVSLLMSLYSSTSQMVSVSHFSQTFLEKIEEELAVRAPFS